MLENLLDRNMKLFLALVGLVTLVIVAWLILHWAITREVQESQEPENGIVQHNELPNIVDYQMPKPGIRTEDFQYEFYRAGSDRWTEEQVARFWISPEETVIEILQQESRQVIETILEEVPE
ncbi:MAG: hypothetical protein ACLFR1_05970 [Spirochaetia bacterium]